MVITLFPEIDCLLCLEKTNRISYSWTTKSYSMNMADKNHTALCVEQTYS